ncbi:MAG TPA: calcium/sodium antiporter [Bacteroidaceae bacterium]|nr:calcium/sodium antiporter [Bacteroidaceae bacterium]HOD68753.1 calcium/sodium antiporter [Bacteroidaceae bacterium]HQL26259.1 calcium/sodium antiporter [Bacteroidaceae bacterium]
MNSQSLIMILQLIAGLVLLFFGGDWLVNGGVTLAHRFRISPLVIGMTIVAFGTSAPELLVSMTSAIKGISGIAMGNVLGSNIANIGLILGLTAMLSPIATNNRKITANGVIMILASLLLLLFSLNSIISRVEGIVMFSGLVVFTAVSIKRGRMSTEKNRYVGNVENIERRNVENVNIGNTGNTEGIEGSENENSSSEIHKKEMSVWAAILLVILSCLMLYLGAEFLVDGATSLAKALGVSDKVIGLTIVAIGTSLPELAASVAAALKKEMEISIGNIIGSNIFNILCVLGLSAFIRPIEFDFTQYRIDFMVMIAFATILVILIRPRKGQSLLGRAAGMLMFAAYAVYAWTLF